VPYHNEQTKPRQVFDRNVVAAIDNVLEKIPGHNDKSLKGGRHAIAKTGTWEYKDGKSGENGDAWTIGATREIAASVWIGNYDKNNNPLPIKTANGKNMSGGSVPGAVWKLFMDLASKYIDAPDEDFLPNVKVGDPNLKGNGLPPLPVQEPQQNCILGGLFCPGGDGQGNGNGNGNGKPDARPNPLPTLPAPGGGDTTLSPPDHNPGAVSTG
jgi:membrane peptidoglycan carboxypeptidase